MGDFELDTCVSCGAGLISVSDICPQCGWPKNKPIKPAEPEEEPDDVGIENQDEFVEKVADDIKSKPSIKKPTEIKNKISRPAGI